MTNYSTYFTACLSCEKQTNFEVWEVTEDSVGIRFSVGSQTILHVTLSQQQAEVLLDSIECFLLEREKKKAEVYLGEKWTASA